MKRISTQQTNNFVFVLSVLFLSACLIPLSGSAQQLPTFSNVAEKKVDFNSEWDTIHLYSSNRLAFSNINISTFDRRNPIFIHDVIVHFWGGGKLIFNDLDWNTGGNPYTIKMTPFEEFQISKIVFRYSKVKESQSTPSLVIVNGNPFNKSLQNTLFEYRRPEVMPTYPVPNHP